MAAQVSDLYAVRPICSLCCCAFPAALPCYRLDCSHLFCQYCVRSTVQDNSFLCPYDGSTGMAYPLDRQYIDKVEAMLANNSGPNSQEELVTLFNLCKSLVNFQSVPCRAYMKTGNCPNVSRYCYYDHQGNALATKPCPLGPTCNRTAFCPYLHGSSSVSAGSDQPTQMPNYAAGPPQPAQMLSFAAPMLMPNYAGVSFLPQMVSFAPGCIIPTSPQKASPSSHFQYHRMPKWYSKQPAGPAVLVNLPTSDKHYKEVERLFNYTSAAQTIVKIERIQNKNLYMLFANKHESLSQVERRPLKLKHLFHGTRKFSPLNVYDSLTCLDPRFGHGVWGQGTYYARNSSYSVERYGHRLPDGTQQIFCMLVLVGDTVEMPASATTTSLVRPPMKQGTNELFHSVKGEEGDSHIYITYEPNMSYPHYLITFR